jgi:hypothetical protein
LSFSAELSSSYLIAVDCLVEDLKDVVSPDDVKNQQDGEQKVEDVVRRKHLKKQV